MGVAVAAIASGERGRRPESYACVSGAWPDDTRVILVGANVSKMPD